MELANKVYGSFLRKSRKEMGWSQQKLADECFISLRTLSDIERGVRPPREQNVREALAQKLSNPILEYFPQYSLENFPSQFTRRFAQEKFVVERFLDSINSQSLEAHEQLFVLYKNAHEQGNHLRMIRLDDDLHSCLINVHPQQLIKIEVEKYRSYYLDFIKYWGFLLDSKIVLRSNEYHCQIFEAILTKNSFKLSEALEWHLSSQQEELEEIIRLIKNN